MINVFLLHEELSNAGLPVIGVSADGRIDYSRELTPEEQATADAVVAAHDPNGLTADEQMDADARAGWKALPGWAAWTPQEGQDYVTTEIFSGQTQEQVDAWIDNNVASLADAKAALKLMAANIIALRTILGLTVKVILFIKQICIKRL